VKLLLADDHSIVTWAVEELVKGTAYTVAATVRDGSSVLELLPSARPDILVLDVNMPGRSGLDILRTLRSRGDMRPVILLTGSMNTNAAIEAVRLGVNGIVLKERAPDVLIECLDAVKNGRRWIEQNILQKALDSTLDDGGDSDALAPLSNKERAVAGLVAKGLRNSAIGSELGISVSTVKVHLHNIFDKLGISSRTELALLAQRADD
jgi:two-component system, NarL family, nitrate/nitrite response regulator NarL